MTAPTASDFERIVYRLSGPSDLKISVLAAYDALLAERDALARFAAKALDALRGVNIGNDWDGGDAQTAMLACGLIESFAATEACGEDCACADVHGFPCRCYRLSALGQSARQTP